MYCTVAQFPEIIPLRKPEFPLRKLSGNGGFPLRKLLYPHGNLGFRSDNAT